MRILIVKLSAIGDVIQSLCVASSLKRGIKDIEISWVVSEAAYPLLKDHPLIDHVFLLPRRRWGKMVSNIFAWPKLLSEIGEFVSQIRYQKFDVVVDLQGLFKSGLVTFISKSKRKVGFPNTRELSYIFLNEKLPPYDIEKHAVLRYVKVASYLGGDISKIDFPLAIKDSDRDYIDKLVKGCGDIIALNVGASWPNKKWTVEGFSELAKEIYKKWGLSPVITGGRADEDFANKIEEKIKKTETKVINLAGKTSLLELAALFERSKAVVTSDSGPMHLAVAAGARVVALFGPTAPWRTGPFGEDHKIVRTNISCSPCFKRRCDDPKCMKAILVSDVVSAIEEVLRDQKSDSITNILN